MVPKAKGYNELFRFETQISVLHSEFFATSSLRQGGVLIISDGKSWNSFIDKKGEKRCLKAGLDLFSSKRRYAKYAGELRDYLDNIAKPIVLEYKKPKQLERAELKKVIKDLSRFWYLYCFTEHSFHNLAYEVSLSGGNAILQENLKDLGELKLVSRETLSAYMFKGGVIDNILKSLSVQFLKDDDANFLFSHELLDLFLNKRVEQKIIDNRKKCYAMLTNDVDLREYSYTDSLKIFSTFVKVNQEVEVRGVIANRGVVTGKAVIAPMFNDISEVNEIVAKMNKGDILVAQTTSPEYMVLCKLAGAIVADQGGMLSHAAIVSRELGIPCIVGTKIATKIFKDGDVLEVDANSGLVRVV